MTVKAKNIGTRFQSRPTLKLEMGVGKHPALNQFSLVGIADFKGSRSEAGRVALSRRVTLGQLQKQGPHLPKFQISLASFFSARASLRSPLFRKHFDFRDDFR